MSPQRHDGTEPERAQFEAALAGLRESFQRLEERHARLLEDPARPLASLREELESLQRRLQELEAENRRLASRAARTEESRGREEQSDLLAHLYVAGFHLHRSLRLSELLSSIHEILINLVGTESHGIYLMDGEGRHLIQVADDGPEAATAASRPIPVGEGIMGVVAKTGIPYFDADRREGDFHNPVACVPMKADGRVLGVIHVSRLLSHKQRLTSQDHEIFTLLAETAGTAMVSSLLRRRFLNGGREPGAAWRDLLEPVFRATDSPPASADTGAGRRP